MRGENLISLSIDSMLHGTLPHAWGELIMFEYFQIIIYKLVKWIMNKEAMNLKMQIGSL